MPVGTARSEANEDKPLHRILEVARDPGVDIHSGPISGTGLTIWGSYAMALTNFGFIVRGAGLDPARDVQVMKTSLFKMTTIGISRPDQGLEAAQRLVADGAQLIELCGAFGPVWTAKIIEAIDDAVPIGSVAYGPEAVDRVHAIFA